MIRVSNAFYGSAQLLLLHRDAGERSTAPTGAKPMPERTPAVAPGGKKAAEKIERSAPVEKQAGTDSPPLADSGAQNGGVDSPVQFWESVARFLATLVIGSSAALAIYEVFSAIAWLHLLHLGSGRRICRWLGLNLGKGHVIVCGVGGTGLQLITQFRRADEWVVAIEKNAEDAFLPKVRSAGALVVLGDAAASISLREAGIRRAKYIIAVCDRDDTNVEIAVRASEILKSLPTSGSLGAECFVHVVDLELTTLFRQHRLLAGGDDRLRVRIFNFFENSARLLFQQDSLEPLNFGASDSRRVHLVIVGFGQMGRSVALQAARLGHYANGKKLRLSVIDKEAGKRKTIFYASYPCFGEICDVEFIESDAQDPSILDKMCEWGKDASFITTYAICFDDDHRSLGFALQLARHLKVVKPIRVRMASASGLASLLKGATEKPAVLTDITPFGLVSDACGIEQVLSASIDLLAQVIHEAYVEKRTQEGRSTMDSSMLPWEQLEQDFVDSNRQQADHIRVKLQAIGCCSSAEPRGEPIDTWDAETEELLAKMEHARWTAERRLSGWKCASAQDGQPEELKARRLSPLLVDWAELDDSKKEWDRETVEEIPRLLAVLNEKIFRQTSFGQKMKARASVTML